MRCWWQCQRHKLPSPKVTGKDTQPRLHMHRYIVLPKNILKIITLAACVTISEVFLEKGRWSRWAQCHGYKIWDMLIMKLDPETLLKQKSTSAKRHNFVLHQCVDAWQLVCCCGPSHFQHTLWRLQLSAELLGKKVLLFSVRKNCSGPYFSKHRKGTSTVWISNWETSIESIACFLSSCFIAVPLLSTASCRHPSLCR